MTKVKICGIRSYEAAAAAIEEGADFLGFNFVPHSRRFINPESAKDIIEKIRGKTCIVGVFQNQDIAEVTTLSDLLGLEYVQLHGDESPAYCKEIGKEVIKAFCAPSSFEPDKLVKSIYKYVVKYIMLDRLQQGAGDALDVKAVVSIASCLPTFLAGGLTAETVSEAVRRTKPFAVDVASGIETNGKEDLDKIRAFITNAKKGGDN